MKKLLITIALLLSIVPAYAMEEGGKKKGGKLNLVIKKKPAGPDKKLAEGSPKKTGRYKLGPDGYVAVEFKKRGGENAESAQGGARAAGGAEEEGGGARVVRKAERPRGEFPRVFFSPGTDLEKVFTALVGQEQKRMRGAFYTFKLKKLATAIGLKIKEGKKASFVVNEKEGCLALYNIIKECGGALYAKSRKRTTSKLSNIGRTCFEHMHSKFMIFDDVRGRKLVITGSYNPTDQGQKNWENVVVLDDPDVVRAFEEEHRGMLEFSNLIAGKAANNEPATGEKEEEFEGQPERFPQANFCPDLDALLSKLIVQEQEDIKGAFFRFTLYNLAENMAKKLDERDPFHVTMVVDKSNIEQDFCEALKLIAAHKGEVRKTDDDDRQMHHKFMLFQHNHDNKPLVWTGSFQGTGQSCRNWENVVVLDDEQSIRAFRDEFASRLKDSKPIEQWELDKKKAASLDARKLNRIA